MKRYINLLIAVILFVGIVVMLFYFLIRSDNSYVTYIKLQVNPSFVIGINDKKNVVFYNSLNSDGNRFNLSMFQGKSLYDATLVFINELGNAQEDKNEINLTVMTKNKSVKEEIINIMSEAIVSFDSNYLIKSHEATHDELERYSNETVYNVSPSLTNEELESISEDIYNKVDSYIQKQIDILNLNKLSNDHKNELLKEKEEDNYFNDFNILSINEEYDILEKSNYEVIFNYGEDSYTYNIILNLIIETSIIKDKTIIEEYNYTYEKQDELGEITNLKTYFYTFWK